MFNSKQQKVVILYFQFGSITALRTKKDEVTVPKHINTKTTQTSVLLILDFKGEYCS